MLFSSDCGTVIYQHLWLISRFFLNILLGGDFLKSMK